MEQKPIGNGSEEPGYGNDVESFRNVPQGSESFGNVPNDSANFGSIPNASEQFGNVLHASEGVGNLRKASTRKESHTITTREAARLFEGAGVARTERSIVNWCQRNRMG